MGFCTETEHKQFLKTVKPFDKMLCESGIQIIKYYLDILKDEQKIRLEDRRPPETVENQPYLRYRYRTLR